MQIAGRLFQIVVAQQDLNGAQVSTSSRSLTLALALLVFITGTVFLVADLAFGWRLGVVNAMLHRLCCTKEGEDRLKVVIV